MPETEYNQIPFDEIREGDHVMKTSTVMGCQKTISGWVRVKTDDQINIGDKNKVRWKSLWLDYVQGSDAQWFLLERPENPEVNEILNWLKEKARRYHSDVYLHRYLRALIEDIEAERYKPAKPRSMNTDA